MVFDHPFLYHGMAEMHDRHREMRLDVDNMSYEVKRKYIVFPSISCSLLFLLTLTGVAGIVGIGGAYRRREHWIE